MTDSMADAYQDFLAAKTKTLPAAGFDPGELASHLFPFQADIVRWALRRGKAAVFADTGLGKTPMQLEWARQVALRTGKPVLILAPLACAKQHTREAEKFGMGEAADIGVYYIRSASDAVNGCPAELWSKKPGVYCTNYERLEAMLSVDWGGVVLDSWGCIVKKPSDVHPDYDDAGYVLPPIEYHHHVVAADPTTALAEGKLFVEPASTLNEQRKARRSTLDERVAMAASLVPTEGPSLVWCELNDESSALAKLISGAEERVEQAEGGDTSVSGTERRKP